MPILSLKSVGDIALSGLPRFQEVSLLKINYTQFPFAIALFKLHLNHAAIFAPNPAYLRNRCALICRSFSALVASIRELKIVCLML
jgi:hypothetical protein